MHDGELDLVQGPALRQGIHAVFGPQPGSQSLFQHRLDGRHRVELGVEGVALHREGALPGDIVLPGQSLGSLKEGLKVGSMVPPHHQQHPLAGAQVQIHSGNVFRTSLAAHSPILRLHLRQAQPAQLLGAQALQAKQGGDQQFQFSHDSLLIPVLSVWSSIPYFAPLGKL